MPIEHFKQLAQSLVDLFYPLVESTLFDRDGNIHEIFNAFSPLKEDQELNLKNYSTKEIFSELLVAGKNVRSTIYPFHKGENENWLLKTSLRFNPF